MQDTLNRLKNRGFTPSYFIDVGAHTGETYEIIQRVYSGAKVYSFEANPHCEEKLKEKTSTYEICLLGDSEKTGVQFFIDPSNNISTGCSIYKENSNYFKEETGLYLNMHRLDNRITIDTSNVPEIFLKLDVQGAEIDVLNGATGILPYVKWIYLEVSFTPCNNGAPLFADVFKHLSFLGYRIADIEESTYISNVLIQTNFLFVR